MTIRPTKHCPNCGHELYNGECLICEYKSETEPCHDQHVRWQPIASAPKGDGKWGGPRILCWYPELGEDGEAHTARFDPDAFSKKPRPFWGRDSAFGKTDARTPQPTHWAPLPEGPK